ncbi:site-specific DNA methylase [uncultured Mediterranean phage uvDeep-CGR2-AD3-C76]|nr:site-specific DNA methylase [uncultured Mediterranean phage uvDeep-CGR2-AD3-C76]
MPLTVGSLFSGIGGFDLGLERAGMVVKWQVERDLWCQKVLAKHWPDVPRYTNVEDVGSNLECVDLICGGFPCQPVSVAGDQKGISDDRWLWPEFRRIVGVLRPRYVLVENVPGLFAANGGHAFGEVIGDLADLGYDCEWTVLSAADVGAPHLRKRVWIVADADAYGRDPKSDGQGRESRSSFGSTVALGERRVDQRRRLGQEPRMADADRQSEGSKRIRSDRERFECEAQGVGTAERHRHPDGSQEMADADHEGQSSRTFQAVEGTSLSEFTSSHQWWRTEPNVGRVAHGVPLRVDRLKGLGNAIVPQCAEWIGRRLVQANGPEEKGIKPPDRSEGNTTPSV